MEKLILWLSPFSEVAAIGDLNIVPNFYHSITFSSRKKTRERGCPLPPRCQYNHSESFFRLFSCSDYCLKILALNHIVTQDRLREIIFCQPFCFRLLYVRSILFCSILNFNLNHIQKNRKPRTTYKTRIPKKKGKDREDNKKAAFSVFRQFFNIILRYFGTKKLRSNSEQLGTALKLSN